MEDQKKLLQFVTWLGENVPELKGQTPEQIVSTINKLSESPEGQEMLQGLVKEFESSMTGVFKKGGKLDYLLCLKKGGSIKDCGCGKKIEKGQQGIPNLEYNEATQWIKDKNVSGMQHNVGTYRSAGDVSSFEPSIIGKGLGIPTMYETGNFKSYAESPKDYLDRHKNFQNQLSSQSRLEFEHRDPGIAVKQDGGRVFGSEQYPYARRSGLDEFTWNGTGKRYSTALGNAQPKSAPLGNAQPTVNKVMTGEGDPNATKRKDDPGVWYPGRPSR